MVFFFSVAHTKPRTALPILSDQSPTLYEIFIAQLHQLAHVTTIFQTLVYMLPVPKNVKANTRLIFNLIELKL